MTEPCGPGIADVGSGGTGGTTAAAAAAAAATGTATSTNGNGGHGHSHNLLLFCVFRPLNHGTTLKKHDDHDSVQHNPYTLKELKNIKGQ